MAISNTEKSLDFNVEAEAKAVDTSKKVRIGIVGTGWIAESHINYYKKFADVEIVAGADLVPGKAEAFFKKFGIEGAKCYGSHKEMLADKDLKLDGVSVCTYNMTHAECTIDCLDAGINVLLEKPMCVTLEEGIEILKAEKRSGKILTIGFQPRFDPNMKMVKEVVQSGVLGKIYYIQTGGGRRRGIPTPYGTTFIEKETGGIGALGDIGCYSLDMLLNAIGYPKPLTVTGITTNYFGTDPNYIGYKKSDGWRHEYAEKFGVDDFAAGFVRLEGDITLDFRIGWAENIDYPCDAIILGTKGGLRIPATDCWNGSIGGPLTVYSEVGGEQVETKIPMKESNVSCFELKLRSFVDAIKTGSTTGLVPASEIIYNQAILSGIKKSADVGREIEIEIPEI